MRSIRALRAVDAVGTHTIASIRAVGPAISHTIASIRSVGPVISHAIAAAVSGANEGAERSDIERRDLPVRLGGGGHGAQEQHRQHRGQREDGISNHLGLLARSDGIRSGIRVAWVVIDPLRGKFTHKN